MATIPIESMKDNFDVIFIGSSITNIFEAILRAKRGQSILILESDKKVGGCWRNEKILSLDSTENGCHVFFHKNCDSKVAYKLLSDEFNLDLTSMKPTPFYSFPNPKINYPLEHEINSLYLEKSDKGKSFFHLLKVQIKLILAIIKYKFFSQNQDGFDYLYPKKGTYELIEKLMSQMAQYSEIQMVLSSNVTSMKKTTQGQFEVEVNENSTFTSQELYLTSGSKVSSFTNEKGETIPLNYNENTIFHFNILLKDSTEPKFSFVEFDQNKYFYRMSDVTTYSVGNTEGKRVISLRIRPEVDHIENNDSLVEEFIANIKEKGLVDSNAELIDYKRLDYQSIYRREDEIHSQNQQLPENCEIIWSKYLLEGIYKRFTKLGYL